VRKVESAKTRKQLIGMLREMGVQGVSGESLEALESILKDENRKRWLKDATRARNQRPDGIIRRRRTAEDAPVADGDPISETGAGEEETDTISLEPVADRRGRDAVRAGDDPGRLEPIPEPEHTHQNEDPFFDRTADTDKYVLRRADGRCELCDTPETGQGLESCFFGDPEVGAARGLKTVAALCPVCAEKIRSGILPADLKLLTRKARGKVITDVPVSKKKASPSQGTSRPAEVEERKDGRAGNKEKRDYPRNSGRHRPQEGSENR
jgi:hypothetical protein